MIENRENETGRNSKPGCGCDPECCTDSNELTKSQQDPGENKAEEESEIRIKSLVKEKYSQIAVESGCGCGTGCCGDTTNVMAEDYQQLKGYNPEADLGLGCGLPTQFAQIKEGDTVVDLGSGAGNDAFVASAAVGETGKVIGIDFSEKMLSKAKANAAKLHYTNVEFRLGDIEDMPLRDNLADVMVSNCVLNLVPNKQNVFAEIYRVLKPGGHFSIADIVLNGDLPNGLQASAAMYVGCVSGAIQKIDYLQAIEKAGFKNILIQKERKITLPDEVLRAHLSQEDVNNFNNEMGGIYSITVFAEK